MALNKTINEGRGVNTTYHMLARFTDDKLVQNVTAVIYSYTDKSVRDADISQFFTQRELNFPNYVSCTRELYNLIKETVLFLDSEDV